MMIVLECMYERYEEEDGHYTLRPAT